MGGEKCTEEKREDRQKRTSGSGRGREANKKGEVREIEEILRWVRLEEST